MRVDVKFYHLRTHPGSTHNKVYQNYWVTRHHFSTVLDTPLE